MDREGFAKVSRWCRESNFLSRKFTVAQLLYYGCHHTWRVPEIQGCNVTFCESFANVPRALRKSCGWDLKGGALSFSQLPHFHTLSLSLSISLSLTLTLSIFHLTPSLSPSLSLSHSPSLSLSLSHSLTLAVCLSLSLSLSLSLPSIFSCLMSLVSESCTAMVPRKFRESSFFS